MDWSAKPRRPSRHVRHLRALHRDLGLVLELLRTGQVEEAA